MPPSPVAFSATGSGKSGASASGGRPKLEHAYLQLHEPSPDGSLSKPGAEIGKIQFQFMTIRPADLPRSINRDVAAAVGAPPDSPTISMVAQSPMFTSEPKTLREMEEFMILRVLDKYQGDKPRAAKELGIALKTLYNRLSQMGSQRDAG